MIWMMIVVYIILIKEILKNNEKEEKRGLVNGVDVLNLMEKKTSKDKFWSSNYL